MHVLAITLRHVSNIHLFVTFPDLCFILCPCSFPLFVHAHNGGPAVVGAGWGGGGGLFFFSAWCVHISKNKLVQALFTETNELKESGATYFRRGFKGNRSVCPSFCSSATDSLILRTNRALLEIMSSTQVRNNIDHD